MAKVYALVVGIAFLLVGILGFVLVPHSGELFGILAVNRPHDVIHVAVGILGIAAAFIGWSRAYCLGLGVVYELVGVLGFIPSFSDAEGMLFHRLHLNLADNILHLVVGGLGLVVFALAGKQPTSPKLAPPAQES